MNRHRSVRLPFATVGLVAALLFATLGSSIGQTSQSEPFGKTLSSEVSGPRPLTVSLSGGPYYVGSVISAVVVIPNATTRPKIDLGGIRDFEARVFDISPTPDSNQEKGFIVRINLLPRIPGTLRLPALEIGSASQKFFTNSVSLEVAEPEPAGNMSLVARVSEATCYVGQPVTLEVTWTLDSDLGAVQAVDLRAPILEHRDFKSRDFSSLPKEYGTAIGLPVSNARTTAGHVGSVIRFRKIVVPQKPGFYTFRGAAVLCSVSKMPPGKRSGVGMGFMFAPQYDNQFFADAQDVSSPRIYARAAMISIRVLPLPAAGKPVDFTGIVGRFSMEAEADPTTMREGEPFTFTVRVRDYQYPEVWDLPPFSQLAGFRGRFRIPADRGAAMLEETENGLEKSFRQSFRAVSTGVDRIPSIAIAYFDPEVASYRIVRTPEIPLVVQQHGSARGFDAVLSDGGQLKNVLAPKQLAIGPNFAAVELELESVERLSANTWFLWLVLGLPPLIVAVILKLTQRQRCRRVSPALEAERWAYSDFLAATRDAVERGDLKRALNVYLARRLGLHVVTFGVVEELLRARQIQAEDLQALREFFAIEDRIQYSAFPVAVGVLQVDPRAIRTLVASIENNLSSQQRKRWWFPSSKAALLMIVAATNLPAAERSIFLVGAEELFQAGIAKRFDDPEIAQDAFRKSAASFEHILDSGEPRLNRGRLHYNTGAARYFAGDFGLAVYHFRMAERFLPEDKRVRAALAYVRSRQPDSLNAHLGRRLWEVFGLLRASLSPSTWKAAFVCCYLASWMWLLFGIFCPSAAPWKQRRWIWIGGCSLAILAAISVYSPGRGQEGVLVEAETVARSGPASIYEPAFETPLHAGAEFRILAVRAGWYEIMIPGSKVPCWIPVQAVRVLI